MASSNSAMKCSICLEEYNETNCRPRTLPCAHKFCGTCLQNCIEHGGKSCSICRKRYTASTVDDIPIDTDMEKLLQLYSHMALNTPNTNGESDGDFSKGQCSKHRKSLLYFKCTTHALYICRECTVLEHSPDKCIIIEIKEELTKERQHALNQARQSILSLTSAKTSLGTIIDDKDKVITSMQKHVETTVKKIEEEKELQDRIKEKINKTDIITKEIQGIIENLQGATTKKTIEKEYLELQGKAAEIEKDLTEIKKCGIEDFSNALLKVGSLLSVMGSQPIVYLALEADGRALGRVRILLTCGPKRQEQMIRLCTGIGGSTFKGSFFDIADMVDEPGENIECFGYMTACGNRDNRILVKDAEQQDTCNPFSAGAVTGYAENTDICICTTDLGSFTRDIQIGHVVSGLGMLSQAIRQYAIYRDASQIKIIDSGVEISA